jgi:hypothetical protein
VSLPIARRVIGWQMPTDIDDFAKKLVKFSISKMPFAPPDKLADI